PRVVTDASAAVFETRRYWPFGERLVSLDPADRVTFAGMELDPESGSPNDRFYDHARDHSAGLGRFLSVDLHMGRATDPQTWNRYAYSRNNPVSYEDPDGEDFDTFLAGIVDAFGSNLAFGAGRGESVDPDFKTGQKVGDALSIVEGALEAAVGGGGEVIGVSL